MVEFNFEVEYIVTNENSEALIAGYREDTRTSALFLINQHTGQVYFRQADSWINLFGTERRAIIARFVSAQHNDIPAISVRNSLFTVPPAVKFAG